MATINTSWVLKLKDEISASMRNIEKSIKKSTDGLKDFKATNEKLTPVNITAIAESFRGLGERLNQAIQPGIEFQNGLAEVEAITGVTGDALDALGATAREAAMHFGGSAAESLTNYKVLLSKLGPDIGQSKEALSAMNNHVLTLSKTMGGNAQGAVEALTTSLLQYRVDLSDPIKASQAMARMMNVMAAGAKEGAAEVTEISAGIKVAGVAASQSNVTFEETNAALQELAKGGKNGAEAGVALRNVLGKMAGAEVIPSSALKQLEQYGVDMAVVSDKTLPLTTRLRELAKAQNDATAFAQVFGVENAAAAAILTRSVDAQDALKEKITDTNTAHEQANVIMGTFSETMKRMQSWVNNVGISIANLGGTYLSAALDVATATGSFLGDLKNTFEGIQLIKKMKFSGVIKKIGLSFLAAGKNVGKFTVNLIRAGVKMAIQATKTVVQAAISMGTYIASVVTATAAQWGLNIAMNANPIGLIVLGIAAAIAAVVALIKYWDEIRDAIVGFTKWILKNNPFMWMVNLTDKIFPGFKDKVMGVFTYIKEIIFDFWEKIKGIWDAITGFFGFGDEEKEVTVKTKTEGEIAEGEVKPIKAAVKDKKNEEMITTSASEGVSSAFDFNSGGGDNINDNTTNTTRTNTVTMDVKNIFNMGGNDHMSITDLADLVVEKIKEKMEDSEISLA